MVDAAPRAALLARPGVARERLLAALQDAGADVVLVADPTQSTPEELVSAQVQAVLVALEPSVETALDTFEAVLADPAMTVIFDEAELAATREGWDAARWARHLSAKLHRHTDVLPPGGEAEPEFDIDIEAGRLSLYQRPEADGDLSGIRNEAQGMAEDVPRDSLDVIAGFDFDPVAAEAGPSLLELDDQFAPVDSNDTESSDRFHQDMVEPEERISTTELPVIAESGPSLVGLDEAYAPAPTDDAASRDRFHQDIVALEARISTMELMDVPRDASERQGAVVILAGIGGPDAVRQLLGGLPIRFPRAVLIQQRLDGARHDKLVRQMQRATEMPVTLAEIGHEIEPGHVYILPSEIGVAAGDGGAVFTADDGVAAFAGLPANDTAIILLSGSDAHAVDGAMTHAAHGALVAGQSPEGCYDASAAQALVARGAETGSPANLAKLLAARWPA